MPRVDAATPQKQRGGMPGSRPDSPWYATPEALRHRKHLGITISDEEREILDALAAEHFGEKGERMRGRVIVAAIVAFSRLPKASRDKALAEATKPRAPKKR